MDLSERLPVSYIKNLDGVLQDCGFEPRDEDALHDAVTDAHCCAKVYMHLIKLPETKKSSLGFVNE